MYINLKTIDLQKLILIVKKCWVDLRLRTKTTIESNFHERKLETLSKGGVESLLLFYKCKFVISRKIQEISAIMKC